MAYVPAKILTIDGEEINCMFNPTEYNLSNKVNYSKKDQIGKDNKILQFVSGGTETLSLSLIFNTLNFNDEIGEPIAPIDNNPSMDVSIRTKKIYNLTKISSDDHKPPECTFIWSSLQFRGIITNINQKFTMFLDDGTPVRATMTLTFENTVSIKKPLHSPDRTKFRVLNEGMELWEQAYKEYDDASKWREIARANNISNPLDIKSGDSICIPPL